MFVHFYHRLIHKYTTLFGTLFNNFTLVRYNNTFTEEIERIKVPLVFAEKEAWVGKVGSQSGDFPQPVEIILPRMSYAMVGFAYDSPRKQPTVLKNFSVGSANNTVRMQYNHTPWDINFELYVQVRNQEDGFQILEMILPYFQPDYTIPANLIPNFNLKKDIPVFLNNINKDVQYESDLSTVRMITYTYTFTMKAFFFGPIVDAGIIRTAIVTFYDDLQRSDYVKLNLNNGSGDFMLESIAFQGRNPAEATAYGKIVKWTANNELHLSGIQGAFTINQTIKDAASNAAYNLASFKIQPPALAKYTVSPNPITANANSNYGYTESWSEYPNAE
jgi:hypothetical protein